MYVVHLQNMRRHLTALEISRDAAATTFCLLLILGFWIT